MAGMLYAAISLTAAFCYVAAWMMLPLATTVALPPNERRQLQ